MTPKILIVRLSSIGDIIQGLGVPTALTAKFPGAETHWLTKREFSFLIRSHPSVKRVIEFDTRDGFIELLRLALRLRNQQYTHLYDAHGSLRSWVVSTILRLRVNPPKFIRRSKERLRRLLFFWFRLKTVVQPYLGQHSYLKPLEPWLGDVRVPPAPQLFIPPEAMESATLKLGDLSPFVALVPSAAWKMKCWPIAHWKTLIETLSEQRFIVLGGPEDHFCEELENLSPARVKNMAGKLSLIESCAVLKLASLTVAADTGLMHAADQLGAPTLALIGPTAFGYPTRKTSRVIEVGMPCRPCSKDGSGSCSQSVYQKCMVEISPRKVAEFIEQ